MGFVFKEGWLRGIKGLVNFKMWKREGHERQVVEIVAIILVRNLRIQIPA